MCELVFFSSRRRHTRCSRDWSSDVCSSDLARQPARISWKLKTWGRPPDWRYGASVSGTSYRSEEHTSELQSRLHLVCRLLLEKKKKKNNITHLICQQTTPTLLRTLYHRAHY